jgi:MtN3 and saliva related transmembrane protein
MTIELVGYIGGLCFAFSALPQTIKTVRSGRAEDLSWGMLLMWLVGEVAMLVYERVAIQSWPLFLNYFFNLLFLLPILYIKIRPRHLSSAQK